jgi:hypothetical protein
MTSYPKKEKSLNKVVYLRYVTFLRSEIEQHEYKSIRRWHGEFYESQ